MTSHHRIIKKIDLGAKRYISELQLNKKTPGFSVLIKKDDKIIYEKSIGRNIISSQNPKMILSSYSSYLCASLTKPMVSKFFIDLTKKYPKLMKTSLDYFFSIKKRSDIKYITVRHLLTHKSGLSDYFGWTGLSRKAINKSNLKQISEFILNQRRLFKPGTRTRYSNSAYVILSRIIEIISGNNYEKELEKYFKFSGLQRTFLFKEGSKNKSAQYIRISNRYIKIPYERALTGWGDSALFSSPFDYLDLINPSTDKSICKYLFKMRSPYGLCYQHTGSSVGTSSVFFFLPDSNIRGVCFQNFIDNFDNITFPWDIYQFLEERNITSYTNRV